MRYMLRTLHTSLISRSLFDWLCVSGYDLIEWLMDRLCIEDSRKYPLIGQETDHVTWIMASDWSMQSMLFSHWSIFVAVEAVHLANLLCQFGYYFPVSEQKNLLVKDDSSLYRFQVKNNTCFHIGKRRAYCWSHIFVLLQRINSSGVLIQLNPSSLTSIGGNLLRNSAKLSTKQSIFNKIFWSFSESILLAFPTPHSRPHRVRHLPLQKSPEK